MRAVVQTYGRRCTTAIERWDISLCSVARKVPSGCRGSRVALRGFVVHLLPQDTDVAGLSGWEGVRIAIAMCRLGAALKISELLEGHSAAACRTVSTCDKVTPVIEPHS